MISDDINRWMNDKYEQYVCYIPDNSKVNKKYFAWTAELRSLNDEGREFHREKALVRKKLRVVEDLEKGRFRFKGWEQHKL